MLVTGLVFDPMSSIYTVMQHYLLLLYIVKKLDHDCDHKDQQFKVISKQTNKQKKGSEQGNSFTRGLGDK